MAKKKAATDETKVGKVKVAKTNEELVTKTLKALKVKPADTHEERIAQLTTHYESSKKELADCDKCGGGSPTDLDACPFCGDEGVDETAKDPASEKPADAKPEKAAAKPKKDALAVKPAEELMPEGVTVEKLDTALSEFIKVKGAGAGAMWDIGRAAQVIYKGQLWKARITVAPDAEDGTKGATKNTYKSWNEFCTKELGMTPANIYNLMDVSEAFTREKAIAFGTTKLALILKAPEEAQPALLEAAKTHGKRQLSKEVDEAKKKAGKAGSKRETGRKKTPAGKGGGRASKTKLKKSDVITIATLIDKAVTIPMFKKPKKGEEATVRAASVEEEPIGWKELDNKVNMVLFVKYDSTGKLQVQVKFTAIEQDEEEAEEGEGEPASE